MIIEYNRPHNLEEALTLLARTEPVTVPLAGGSSLNRPSPDPVAVVDLQHLGLDTLQSKGNTLEMGATLTLEALAQAAVAKTGSQGGEIIPLQPALREAIRREAAYNLRQVATIAGTVVAADGRSPWTVVLLAMDAQLTLYRRGVGSEEQLGLGDFLPLRGEDLRGALITRVSLPLNVRLAYESVSRTPADWPLVCAAAARWPSGRTRLALGGFGRAPLLAMDGPEASGAEVAARNAFSQAVDEWASAEYRSEMAAVLAERALDHLVEQAA